MENTKKTKRVLFGEVLEYVRDNEELTNFISNEIEKLNKKSTSLTANQKANEELKENIMEVLAQAEKNLTATEVTTALNEMLGTSYTMNKVSALITLLKKDNKVQRVLDGKKATFKLVD